MSDPTPNPTRGIGWGEIPVSEALPGVWRQVVQGERQTLVRYVYAPGAVFPTHDHSQEQVTVVLRGRLTFTIEDSPGATQRQVALGPGDVLVIPGGAGHGAAVTGGEEVETLNTLSPRRDVDPVTVTGAREQRQ